VNWVRSSLCESNACVEVARVGDMQPDQWKKSNQSLTEASYVEVLFEKDAARLKDEVAWRTSSLSGNNGQCVEVGFPVVDGVVR